MRSTTWYEVVVIQEGQARDGGVRGNLEGAKRLINEMATGWPDAEMVFVRQHHRAKTGKQTFRVLHKLTVKREVAA